MNTWDVVYLNAWIATVEYPATMFKDDVKAALIKDGYSGGIEVHVYPWEG